MRAKRYTSEGVVIARRDYSEADRFLVVLSKRYGKVTLLAKGVRKPISKKRGALEIFSLIKFAASRGKSFDYVTETQLINSFENIRKDLKRTAVAYFLLEVVAKLTQEDEKQDGIYSLLLDNLKRIEYADYLKKLRKDFIYDSLVELGFWPQGKRMDTPDKLLESITERELSTLKVGRKMLT
jgi:DNA repair protein RecO (recombination protein O)